MKILLLVLLLLIVIYLILVKPACRRNPVIDALKKKRFFAHRGLYDNETEAPENSMQAFKNAVDHGYGIEMDVQLTKDKIPVVFHDFTLKRIARDKDGNPVKGKVSDYTFRQLQSFHLLDSDAVIPAFTSFLDLIHGQVPIIIELKIDTGDKGYDLCEIIDPLLKEYKGIYCIESFNPYGLLWFKKHHPEVIRGQLASHYLSYRKDRMHHLLIYFITQNLMFNFLTKPDFIAYDIKYMNSIARKICFTLFHNTSVVWTARSIDAMHRYSKQCDIFIFENCQPVLPDTDKKQ